MDENPYQSPECDEEKRTDREPAALAKRRTVMLRRGIGILEILGGGTLLVVVADIVRQPGPKDHMFLYLVCASVLAGVLGLVGGFLQMRDKWL